MSNGGGGSSGGSSGGGGGGSFVALGQAIFDDVMQGMEVMGGQQLQMGQMQEQVRQFNETMQLQGRQQAFKELMAREDLTMKQKQMVLQEAQVQQGLRGGATQQRVADYAFRQQIAADQKKGMVGQALAAGVLKGMKSGRQRQTGATQPTATQQMVEGAPPIT